MLLATAMELFDFDQLTISEWALREGIVLDAVGRHDPADWSDDPRAIRRASVLSLARRCNWAEPHARQVAKLALELFDETREIHGLDADDRELLEFAALLHDIGEHVVELGPHSPLRVPRAQRPAARLRPRGDRDAGRARALAPAAASRA